MDSLAVTLEGRPAAPTLGRDNQTPAQLWRRALEAMAEVSADKARIFPTAIAENAKRFAKRPALLSACESYSFATLAGRMNRYSRWALAQGVQPGDVVGLLMPNRPDYVAIWLGVTQVGGVVALLNTNLSGASLAHCIEAAAPRHIIVAAELAGRFAEVAPHLSSAPKVWLHGEAQLDAPRLDEDVPRYDEGELSAGERRPIVQTDRALLIYTSGTTGLPKAAYVSHHRILSWSAWFAALGEIDENDRMYDCLPLYHSVGGVVAIGAALINGGSAVVAERFSASCFWDEVVAWDCTLFQYIGELCRYLVASSPHPAERAHRLRLACGNGMRAEVWTAFQDRFAIPRILEFYAATEANFSLTNVEGKVGAIGKIPSFLAVRNQVALVRHDVATGVPARDKDGFCIRAPGGEVGEAIGRVSTRDNDPAGRFEGYTSAADSERKILRNVFAPGDAWLRSGDLMRIDNQGFYYFVDRVGDTFRWKGENVSTTEVAAALCAHPGIVDAAVYGVSVPGVEGRAGMALVTTQGAFDLDALAIHLKSTLPDYARPLFLRIGGLDLTATFKHKKHELAIEGFDPSRVSDPLYVLDRAQGAYVSLDGASFAAIASGAMRL